MGLMVLVAVVFLCVGLTCMVLMMSRRFDFPRRVSGSRMGMGPMGLGGHSDEDSERERLAEALDSLRDEVSIMREEVLSINERMDFTERLLERPKTDRD